jgi:aminomuconate-semialdehyde/2-hydroxymuconate-6-semialdehyde dehydrogenase
MKPEKYIKNYINGELVPPISGNYIDLYNPAIGEVYAFAPDSSKKDVDEAVEAAEKAFPIWSAMGVKKRFRLMMRLADIIEQYLEDFAQAETEDTGKPITLSRTIDIPRSHSNIRFFATASAHFSSESHHMEHEAINYTLRQQIGVVGCISPWNLPLYLFTWKIAPALASGNCVVAKPSEVTPMTAFLLSKAAIEAGIPPGVLNIIHGYGPIAGQAIIEHPRVKAISFTGGTNTGKKIAAVAAPMFKKLSLELGGKNPNIIFADCDFEKMMATTLNSSFANQGQICLCGSRIFVEASIYEKFREEFVKRVRMLKVGDPTSSITNMGAVVSDLHREKVLSYVELAKQEGGTVLCGGEVAEVGGKFSKGYFLKPTVIEGLSHDCRTNQEEIFGPVVTIMPFETKEEVLMYANSVEYGLSATIWTSNISRAHQMAEEIQAGVVWINCWLLRDLRTPFGGMKASGVGREGGLEALRFFTEAKNVCIKYM